MQDKLDKRSIRQRVDTRMRMTAIDPVDFNPSSFGGEEEGEGNKSANEGYSDGDDGEPDFLKMEQQYTQ